MAEEILILVDENDKQIGTGEKMQVHREGKLHRCFSIFVFNSKGEMLLQKRASSKYHSGGLWTNTCCGHPVVGEDVAAAARRRLGEEMGFDCDLREVFEFTYRAELDNGLTEHEYDHVYVCTYDGEVKPNPEEADGFKYVDVDELKKDVAENPGAYTEWFKIALEEMKKRFPGLKVN